MNPTSVYPKRLIEVDLPIKRISEHARMEKSIRHGHISTLHIWWARRPLAACRAVICASLWPDPADEHCPNEFIHAAVEAMHHFAKAVEEDKSVREGVSSDLISKWLGLNKPENRLNPKTTAHLTVLRNLLFDFIADFSNWDNSTNQTFLDISRTLTQAAHEALGGEKGTRPLVVDPFAGGGSIPLEALRVGADAFASDLNPVAVLLNKVVLEYIPKYGQKLADEVRKWGEWIKKEAEKELAEFYPKDPDGSTPIAYLWARTITCEGPGCGAQVPLMRSLWLAKKNKHSVALKMIPDKKNKLVDFKIITDAKPRDVAEGTVKRSAATCPVCGFTTPAINVREQFKGRNGGADDGRLLAVVTINTADSGRKYREGTSQDIDAFNKAKTFLEKKSNTYGGQFPLKPTEELPYLRSIFNIHLLGVKTWGSLFSSRQMLALTTFWEILKRGKVYASKDSDPPPRY